MVSSEQRNKYSSLRYYYYHAGRFLFMRGNLHAGGIMLGYAVETTMKAGLMEVLPEEQWDKNRILKKEHGAMKIFCECKKYHMFNKDIRVSRAFLDQINNNFQRYPSQIDKKMEDANVCGNAWGNSSTWIHYYDDLIVQLDEYLLKRTSDPSISMIYIAFRSLEETLSRDVLRQNAFALLKFDNYVALIHQNMPDHEDLRKLVYENISKGAAYYWNPYCHNADCNCKKVDLANIAKEHLAINFESPKWKPASSGRYELKIGNMTIS